MKKFKPILLVMIAAFLMFTSSAFASTRYVDITKHENENHVQSEKLYTEGEQVSFDPYMMAAGNANVYVLFEDAKTEDTILMSQLVFRPEMKGLNLLTYHRNPNPGYYYVEINGDYNAFITARLKKVK
ncbi:hypothetical protein B4V02_09185 [Paenibacillus kribbensis]|uniref:Uncharacterized protein n=1 Tax=Paenibacillus kribbensis TaxID=172713 RepID=A0A222WLH7_9BACL|nr:hypothetical protein [Paenibacillus kribbensis]ASR46838.1 hypothetical protein B4V02_09185 [Paenibacillus kribbensis]